MRYLLWLAFVLVLSGCGGAAARKDAAAPPPEPGFMWGNAETVLAEEPAAADVDEDGVGNLIEEARPLEDRRTPAPERGEPVNGKKNAPDTLANPQNPQQQTARPVETLIIYGGMLELRVRRLLEAVDRIGAWVEQAGGYIESLTSDVLVVRVPVARFDEAMRTFATFGEVLKRRVEALDVTARFTDLAARLEVAKQSRQRLVELLEKTKDVQERLRILQEIKRVSEMIETTESQLAALKSLADFSTITLRLTPVLEQRATAVHRSPIPWVRALDPYQATLTEGKDDLALQVPRGFVLFDEDASWRAQAADTSTLRLARVDNEPRGDAAFWAAAVDFELTGRDEEPVADGSAGGLLWRAWRTRDVTPRYYLVAVLPAGEDLFVIEGFSPGEAAWTAHREAVLAALGSARPK